MQYLDHWGESLPYPDTRETCLSLKDEGLYAGGLPEGRRIPQRRRGRTCSLAARSLTPEQLSPVRAKKCGSASATSTMPFTALDFLKEPEQSGVERLGGFKV